MSVRLTFKHEKDAKTAETQFDKQVADGKTLHVKVIGGVNASLTGRLGVGVQDAFSAPMMCTQDYIKTSG